MWLERLLASVKVLAEPLPCRRRPSITVRPGVTLTADSRYHPLPEHIEKQAQTKKDKYLLSSWVLADQVATEAVDDVVRKEHL